MGWEDAVTAIQTRLKLDPRGVKTDLNVIKEWLGIDGNDRDTTLTILLRAAKERADAYCNREFLNADGEELTIPVCVNTYVLNFVAWQAAKKGLMVKEATIQYLGAIEFQPYSHTEFAAIRHLKKPGYTR